VIKRIRFATRHRDGDRFETDFPAAMAVGLRAPEGTRPVRVTVCTVIPELTTEPLHDGVGLEWFADRAHLSRYEAWADAGSPGDELAAAIDLARSPVVVAEEHVMRGADWLESRWRAGGPCLKHMAIARRAAGLTLDDFNDRWSRRAGRVGDVPIPDAARGSAYAQNRPLPCDAGWAYDALNEVWLDDVDALQTRIGWFAENLADREDDLVSRSWFLAARETVV
jgi:hypothetical protein